MVSAGARLFVTGLVLLFSCAGAQRIAIIGGAVSGSFTAKYLADYDTKCTVDIHVFEPYPVREPTRPSDTPDETWYPDETWQGSRVETLKLSDGATIELGASIAHDGNPLVKAMIEGDPELDFAQPFSTGSDEDRPEGGFGIFGGTSWPLPPEDGHTFWRKLKLVLRYNNDLRKVLKASQIAEDSFSSVVFLLNSTEPHTFFPSPDAIWREVGLYKAVHTSFARFLDMIGIREKPGILRRLLPFQGNFREEFLTAINLVNYNQNVNQVNAAVGLASFAAAMGDLFCIEGGNYRLIPSSLKQTKQRRDAQGCSPVQEIERRVTTVVGSLDGFKMYSGQEELGHYDIVVLAAPLQTTQIDFLIQSQNDPSVLQQMPLGGLIETESDEIDPDHEGHVLFPHDVPAVAKRPYTQVTTTIVSNATLQKERLYLHDLVVTPQSILFSESGKASLYNITAMTQITKSGVYKVFSDNPLTESAKIELFGPDHATEYVKIWGGPHGGATPDYQGGGQSTSFLLYDGAHGLGGHTTSGALYYPNAMETSSLACMEICATGAKAVAKLIAQRLGLVKAEYRSSGLREEL